jgi:hypothetical protein
MIVICIKWGTRYGGDYINRLSRSVRRFSGDCRFICFTDDKSGIDSDVEVLPLPPFPNTPPEMAVRPWRKISLWQKDLGKLSGVPEIDGQLALFLDLDVVVTGDLRSLYETKAESDFVVWKNPTKRRAGNGNTSVFRYRIGAEGDIFANFVADPLAVLNAISNEQEYVSSRLGDGTTMRAIGLSAEGKANPFFAGQNRMSFFEPGQVVSFKHDLLPPLPQRWWQAPSLPEGTRVVAFHGKPDPDEARDGRWPADWYKKWYKTVRPTSWIAEYWR